MSRPPTPGGRDAPGELQERRPPPLSIAAGADLVVEYLRGVLGLPIRPERLTYQSGVTMIRHFEEVFES